MTYAQDDAPPATRAAARLRGRLRLVLEEKQPTVGTSESVFCRASTAQEVAS